MNSTHEPHLTSAEIGNLWTIYAANSMSTSMLSHFLQHVEDKDIQYCIQKSYTLSQEILQRLISIFQQEKIPIPDGFSEQDVNLEAPRLFSDTFYLDYLDMMSKLGGIFYSITLPNTSRMDLRQFLTTVLSSTFELTNLITETLLQKGIYVRPPVIPFHTSVEYVKKQSFFNGFFGEKRPLLGIEISQIFSNLQFNTVKSALLTGFKQVTKHQELQDYFLRGHQINTKQSDIFSNVLKKEELSAPIPSSFSVTDSIIAPYSDKLMLFHVTNLSTAKVRNFGDSIAVSTRHDLSSMYGRFLIETGNFAEDGGNLLIEHGWMEQQPHNVDREELLKQKKP